MSKFFYVNRSQLREIETLLDKQSVRDFVVLQRGDRFSDVVRYNPKYDTAVFVTVTNDYLNDNYRY